MTSFKTPTEKLLDKYSWLEPIKKEIDKKTENPSDGSIEITKEIIVHDCKINSSKLRAKLEDSGFFNFKISGNIYLLRLENGSVEIWTDEQMRSYFDLEYIRQFPDEGIKDITKELLENKFLNSKENLLKDSIIKRLQPKSEVKFLEHTQNKAYFPYQNGIVEVSKDDIKLIPYKDSNLIVFKNNILPRNYNHLFKRDWQSGNWYNFLANISKGNDTSRFNDFSTVIGYLLHKYYERKLKAIIWMDSRGNANDPKGRGGKTLLGKGIGYMLNANMKIDKVYCEIDGKNFESKKATKYQEAEINTALIHLNDVEKFGEYKFNLTSIYNDVLEGIKVRKLYQSPFHVSTKLMISANHTFNTDSGSTRDRFLEIQLSGHYDENNSPYDEFKKWFFSSDWDDSDWSQYDNCMLFCVQNYFKLGLRTPENINLYALKAIEESDQDFIDYMDAKLASGALYHDCEFVKSDLLADFVAVYPEHNWLLNRLKSWNRWLRAYTMAHPFFVRCTSDNIDKFDTVSRQNGTSKRVFKYYFTEEYLKGNK
ncbi:MAG: hypothetical protein M9888_03880 [Chitinophagales bacterium]|nr:hypothetical protein [Chitinophagales bacterium]